MWTDVLLTVAIVITSYVSFLFIVAVLIKRNDIADIAWGPGILLASCSALFYQDAFGPIDMLLMSLVGIWALRLALRISIRNSKKSEDPRYRQWRESWGAWFYPRSYLQVFLLQGALMVLLAFSIITHSIEGTATTITFLSYLGVVIWIIGFMFEVIGDQQLDRFIAKKRAGLLTAEILTTGLWRYSRHPNYFGEVTMWWGIWLIVLGSGSGLIALVSPLTITILILFVSGIPMAERQMVDKLGWDQYVRRTSKFIPLPPKPEDTKN